jgi:hypothetical protein
LAADSGEFIVSAVGDVDGDGRSELVYALTIERGKWYLLAYCHDGTTWCASLLISAAPSVEFVRSIAIGDVDADGTDEIVLGTRPSGAVVILDGSLSGLLATTVDRDQFGAGTTNTREVVLSDVDSDGALEIIVATARSSAENWQRTPGAIFLYRRSPRSWDRIVIDDHDGHTHSRMVAVADVKSDGVKRIVSCAVGVVEPETGRTDPEPELRIHTFAGQHAISQPIGTLENMIKSRSFAAGDIDGTGRTALVVGTRALGVAGLDKTYLYIYRYDHATNAWEREILDTSGPFGFHCVAIADVDGDGRLEIIASDDELGLIKHYKKQDGRWIKDVIFTADNPIFCTAIHLLEVPPVTSGAE